MIIRIVPKHIVKTSLGTSDATIAPRILPRITGIESRSPWFMLNDFLRMKVTVAARFCIKTAIRFVPLATLIGKPKAINIVIVIIEPPPASVLITPTAVPEISSMMTICQSICFSFFEIRGARYENKLKIKN